MQTSTMWLQEQIFNSDWKNMSGEDKLKLFEQAKEMEKQQIMNGFNQGYREGWIDAISGDCTNDQDVETFEDANIYYNETYGSKGSDETKTN